MRAALFPLLLVLLAATAADADWVALASGASPGTPPTIRTISSDATSTVLEVTVPGFWAEITPHGWRFRLPDGLISMVEGRPELPFIGCTVAMPAMGTPTLLVRSADFALPGNFVVRMAPRPELEGQIHLPPPPAAAGIPFPEQTIQVAHSGYWRELPLLALQIHPFRAQGNGVLVGVATHMVVEVVHPPSKPQWPDVTVPQEFRDMARATVANFDFLPAVPEPSERFDAPPTEYLVIANTALAPGVQALLDWRKEQGYVTELVATTSTSPSKIKNEIRARYNQGKLLFVVLVGDYAQIPHYSWSGTDSDMWYACLTGSSSPDLFPDVGLGRLSGTKTAEISHQVDKILKYERNPPAGDWFTKTILAAHREQAPGKYVGCKMAIASGCLKTSGWTIITQYGHKTAVSNSTVTGFINKGVGLVNYRGHGSTTGWVSGWNTHSGEYNISLVKQLTNGDMTPIVFNIACYNGRFDSNCLQEAWLRATDGAVASLAAIMPSYTTPNHDYDKTLYSAIFCNGLTNIYGFYYKATQKIISLGSYGQKNAKMYWWGGDACTNLWSCVPKTLTVVHPATINTGNQNVRVTVRTGSTPVVGGKVCLYKGAEVYAVKNTDASGNADFSIYPSPGTILVTVSAKDCMPNQSQITVVAGGASLYMYGSSQLGTKMSMSLKATKDGGLPYLMGSSFGMGPIRIDTRNLELGPDPLLWVSTGGFLPMIFVNYSGILSTTGTATAGLNIPRDKCLVGMMIYTAFLTMSPPAPSGIKSISNTEGFMIIP